jgi:hypothetical protein
VKKKNLFIEVNFMKETILFPHIRQDEGAERTRWEDHNSKTAQIDS